MTESKKILAVKGEKQTPDDLGLTCEWCADTFSSKQGPHGLTAHQKICPDKPTGEIEPDIKTIDVDTEEISKSIIDTLNLPNDVKALLNDSELDEKIQKLLKEVTELNTAKKVKDAIADAEVRKLRQKLKEIGYQRNPEVYGRFKKIILISLEYVAPCLERETRNGWEVIPGLCAAAPNGSVYIHFEKK